MTPDERTKQAIENQVALLKSIVNVPDSLQFVDVPVELLHLLIEEHEQLAAVIAERDALKFHVMDEDAVKTLGNVSYDLEQCEAKLAAATAEGNAAIRDKAHLSEAILTALHWDSYTKVFELYHRLRGTYGTETVIPRR